MAEKSPATNKTAKTGNALETETHKNVNKIIEIEQAQKQNRTAGEKISDAIAAFCGSMVFVWVHVFWFGGWIVVNSLLPFYQFDPFPYTFLTLVVSLEAIFLSTFILISQNHETRLTERRNHLDLQINMLAEKENTKILKILSMIGEKVGIEMDDPDLHALVEEIEPEKLVDQIMDATGSKERQPK